MELVRKILVIDDEMEMLENCSRILGRLGYDCLICDDSERVLDIIKSERPDLVITDLKMPRKDGITIVAEVRGFAPEIPVIVMTGFASIDSAVEAMKAGAFDYLTKPFTLDHFRLTIDRALQQVSLKEENKNLKAQLLERYQFNNIIGRSSAIQEVFEVIKKVASSDVNVLILGESGTGKELVARSLHTNSSRVDHPFIPVDCVALPDQLLESELFGYEKGAFTGANSTKPGLMELAHRGSVFLDEIGDLTLILHLTRCECWKIGLGPAMFGN